MPEAEPSPVRESKPRLTVLPRQIESVGVGPVRFDLQATLHSPFFWLVVGAGLTAVIIYYAKKK